MSESETALEFDAAISIACSTQASRLCIECSERQSIELVAHKAATVAEENAEGRLLAIVPNRNAKMALAQEWKHYDASHRTSLHVCTAEEASLFVLDSTNAEEILGRGLSMADELEAKVLLEDMKTIGLKPHRLESLLEFICKGITEMQDEDPSWLVNDEERMVLSTFQECLAERGAVFPCELGNLAMKAIRQNGVPRACQADYVFVVGYTALDRATQLLCSALSGKQLLACGRTDDPGVENIAHPCTEGLSLLAQSEGALLIRIADHSPDQKLVEHRDPEAELVYVTEAIESQPLPSRWIVVAPNNAWLKRIQSELADREVPVQIVARPRLGVKDPRQAKEGTLLRAYGALSLLARPESALAWRTWIGMGDYLCLSNAWDALRSKARKQGVATGPYFMSFIKEGIPFPAEEPWISAFEKLNERVDEGRKLIEHCQGLKGSKLLDAVAKQVGFEGDFLEYIDIPLGPTDDAPLVLRRIRDASSDPLAYTRNGAIITTPESSRYLFADTVCLTGLVDGFIPDSASCDPSSPWGKRAKRIEREKRSYDACLRCASEHCILSTFQEMGLEQASILKAYTERIFIANGMRLARMRTSQFVKHATAAEALEALSGVF